MTGLRAVAACWVMLLHLQTISGPYLDQLPLVRPLIGAGWTGVELFFVLSGFVITLGYLDRVGARPTAPVVGRFLVNRFARVWPAWAVVTVVGGAWVWSVRSAGWDADVVSPHPDAGLGALLRQLSMTQMWGYSELGGSSFVPPGWSISAEWTAYLLFPLAVWLIRPLRRLPAWLLMAAAVAVMSPLAVTAFVHGTPDLEQSWVLRIACGFTAGMFSALAYRRVPRTARTDSAALATVWTCVALALAGTSWAAWAVWERGAGVSIDHYGVIVVLFPLLVVGLSLTGRGPARWLGSAPMVYGGKLSYCLYLVHFLVLDVALTVWWQDPAARGVVNPGLVLAVPGLVLVSLLASAALHHGVEEPGRRLVLQLQERLAPAPRRVSAPTTAEVPRSPHALLPVPRAGVREPGTPALAARRPAGPGTGPGPSPAPLTPDRTAHPGHRAALPVHPSTGRHARATGRTRETVRTPL
nr:acyltransferase [Modestobacter marinus]